MQLYIVHYILLKPPSFWNTKHYVSTNFKVKFMFK